MLQEHITAFTRGTGDRCFAVSGPAFSPRHFSSERSGDMTTMTLTGPMNSDTLNDTGIGIGVLASVAFGPAPVLPRLSAGGRGPGF